MNNPTKTPAFFVMRTPMFSLDTLFNIYDRLKSESHEIVLNDILDETFLEAIYLASPVLHTEITKLKTTLPVKEKETRKIYESILKYLIRASTRCTPFGLFAGTSTGLIAANSNLDMRTAKILRNLRIDMDFLCGLANRLKNNRAIRRNLRFYPNTTLHKKGRNYGYIEYKYDSRQNRTFHLAEVNINPVLTHILKLAKTGPGYSDIMQDVLSTFDITGDTVDAYLNDLIENNVLYSSIEPNVTGGDFFSKLVATVGSIAQLEPSLSPLAATLNTIEEELTVLRSGTPAPADYKRIFMLFSGLDATTSLDEGKLFQMDMSRKIEGLTISQGNLDKIIRVFSKIKSLSSPSLYTTQLERFKRAFAEKYEGQTVKLTTLFNNQTGLGYKSATALSDYYHREGPVPSRLEQIALQKYIEFIRTGADQIIIEEEDFNTEILESLDEDCSLMFSIVDLQEDPDKSVFALQSFSLSSSNLLGRFAHADQLLNTQLKAALKEREEGQSSVIAEIAHLPQSRIGNILSRPTLSAMEIEFLALSELPQENKISIDDLYVKIVNNELVLISKKLGKRIVPSLSSAHNFSKGSLDIYHFLSDLQYQNRRGMAIWDWGNLRNQKFLPRVTYSNCILSPAKWVLDWKELSSYQAEKKCDFYESYLQLSEKYRYPMVFIVKEFDNYLTLDMSVGMCRDIAEKMLRKKGMLEVQEFLHNEKLNISDNFGFANEFVIPIFGNKHISNIPPALLKVENNTVQRDFHAGDVWLYAKIYCKPKNQNLILGHLDKITKRLLKEGSISSWFFIRYSDPKPHLRVRLLSNGTDSSPLDKLHSGISRLISDGIITNFTIDTYSRELERYGAADIEKCEQSFYWNTHFVLDLLGHPSGNSKAALQKVALYFIDKVLTELSYSNTRKAAFFNRSFNYFAREFRFATDKRMKETLTKYYRGIRQDIDFLGKNLSWTEGSPLTNRFIANQIDIFKSLNGKGSDPYEVLTSIFHMFINRLFFEQQRFEEFTIYFLLDSQFRSILAKEKVLA
ncbi:hypothetical protein C7T94_03880 [Pedobacter yulinensis]|uniref:Lantibiotic dehydratase n=1 Tax=Pedobacter yulinensis TaxID=2126353 RepID=A0A2T3HN72_9SPHI|nr:lantibiotic dehydratase [Pedobacter yulinensis]PST83895.1 hypothetical protein C7T94_03880 [Pedobacter yulinensis]